MRGGNTELYVSEAWLIILKREEIDCGYFTISTDYFDTHTSKLICYTHNEHLIEIANRDLCFETEADADEAFEILCRYNKREDCMKVADNQ